MATPVNIPLPDHKHGDTWDGMSIGPILFDGQPPPNALASCRLYFRHNRYKTFGYGFRAPALNGFGVITIVDANTWQLVIPPQLLPLAVGLWLWELETTDASGKILTLYAGTLTITQDITNDDH